jgi:transcriptional regulator with XRE-family HTH domain
MDETTMGFWIIMDDTALRFWIKFIKVIRDRGLDQSQAAKKLGIAQPTLSRIIHGQRLPPDPMRKTSLRFYDGLSELMGIEDHFEIADQCGGLRELRRQARKSAKTLVKEVSPEPIVKEAKVSKKLSRGHKPRRPALKKELIYKYGTLSEASLQMGLNYYRISRLVNGYVNPSYKDLEVFREVLSDRYERTELANWK